MVLRTIQDYQNKWNDLEALRLQLIDKALTCGGNEKSFIVALYGNTIEYQSLLSYLIWTRKSSTKQSVLTNEEIEKMAMDELKVKWGHLYLFGYPKRPFPTNYESDLNMVMLGYYKGINQK